MDRNGEIDIEQVSAYLAHNASLRSALHIDDYALLCPRPLGKGEHNLNFTFENPATHEHFVLRINVSKQPFHKDQIRYEYNALQAVAPSGCTPRPLYLDSSVHALGLGVLVESLAEGRELDFDHLQEGDLRCAAQIMADYHAVEVADSCSLHRPKDPLKTLFDECVQRYELYMRSPVADERVTRWMDCFVDRTQRGLNVPIAPESLSHIVNTETLPSHFLIPDDARKAADAHVGSGRFCDRPGSFVDWERPLIGDIAEDLAFFVAPTTTFWDSEFLFPNDMVGEFLADYWQAVNGRFVYCGFEARFEAFRKVAVLRGLTWCCKAQARYAADPNLHRTGKAVAKVPIYLSEEFLARMAKDCFN